MKASRLWVGLLGGGLAAATAENLDLSGPLHGLKLQPVKAVREASPDRTASHFSRLHSIKTEANVHTASSVVVRTLRSLPPQLGHWFQNISKAGLFSTQYAIECACDGLPVWLVPDTGSSDTWAVQTGFECDDMAMGERAGTDCGFGSPLVDGFGQGTIDDLNSSLRYGSGERVTGPMGYSDLGCGGMQVSKQQVGLANYTYWHGNNMTVGILGLAYPSLTSAYYGFVNGEAPWNAVSYTPFLTHAIAQGAMSSVFSVALAKNSSDGLIAWGGLPPSDWRRGRSAVTDLIIANLLDRVETSWRYSFYTIIPDGVRWGQTTDTTKFPYIVDTGTTMNYLPPPLAEAVAQNFEPEAVFPHQWGAYFAPCNAVPPPFAVVISGVEFWLNPADLIYQGLKDPMTGFCAVAIASGGPGPYILGDAFLQSVVAVFDVGAGQMRFYART